MRTVYGLSIRFKPGETDLVEAFEFGYNFGCLLQNKEVTKPKKGARTLVKCLVCGEIFDSSLEVCPVCGVGKENFVPVDVEETTYRSDSNEFYVLLGNGAAGLNAAKAIRERDKTGSITMISGEEYRTYNRPMLTKSLMADLEIDQIQVEAEKWYEDNRIFQVLGRKVVSVDTKEKEVLLSDGIKLKYTKLIYALGSECFIPPIPGHEKAQVAAIRTLEDTRRISAMLPDTKQAVVIGGGVLGLEAAWELKKAGCAVTVLELAPMLMGRQLDANAGDMLKYIAECAGIQIHTGVQIAEITGEDRVTGVKLGTGEVIPAQLVIVSCGVRANTAVAKEMGIEVDRAIVVDSRMQTSLPDVYACGDCAQFEGVNYAIWPQAVEQGKVAGANAAGDAAEYTQVPAALSFHGMNTALFAAGDNGKNPNLLYKTVEVQDKSKKQYEKLTFLNGKLCGVILIGDVSKMGKMTELLEKKATFAEVMQEG